LKLTTDRTQSIARPLCDSRATCYGSDHEPTNSIIALKDDGQSTRSRANPTALKDDGQSTRSRANPTALKDDGQSTRSRANPTRLSSLKGKVKNLTKKIYKYTGTMKTKDTEALGRLDS